MRDRVLLFTIAISAVLITSGWNSSTSDWLVDNQGKYKVFFQKADAGNIREYKSFFDEGLKSVETFVDDSYKSKIKIYIHPNRTSLDKAWQTDWKMPNFKSACWMVASGVDKKMDILSPKSWKTEACEHDYLEKDKTQKLITHELFHVYHGQLNVSPDFSETDGIDWFVEGFATYASGQCDAKRIDEAKKAISNKKIPASLDKFWTGKLRYGLSGSLVKFIDHKYGRKKLKKLLIFNKKSEVLKTLDTNENDLLKDWKEYMEKL